MAKTGKEREWQNVDENGVGTTVQQVKVGKVEGKAVYAQREYRAPSTAESFQKMVASATGDSLNSFYLAAIRGVEASNAAKVRNEMNTTVKIGGKPINLMDPPRAIPFGAIVQAINARFTSIALLSAGLDEKQTSNMLKKESAWVNAKRMLLESGKVRDDGGTLVAA